jgi:hypothetical protein
MRGLRGLFESSKIQKSILYKNLNEKFFYETFKTLSKLEISYS